MSGAVQIYPSGFSRGETNHAIYFNGNPLSLLDPDGVVSTNFSFALSLNLQGEIVGGYVDASNVSHGFLYNGGKATIIDHPGAAGNFAFSINDRREIIGIYSDSNCGQHAFLLREGAFENIDLAVGVTSPFSTDLSEIVGQYQNVPNTTGHGYLESAHSPSSSEPLSALSNDAIRRRDCGA